MPTENPGLIPPAEERLIDAEIARGLSAALGPAVFVELLEDAAFETTDRLTRMEARLAEGNFGAVARLAHDLVAIAGQIGFAAISRIAADLEITIDAGDHTAARAIAARLLQTGEETLAALGDEDAPAARAGP